MDTPSRFTSQITPRSRKSAATHIYPLVGGIGRSRPDHIHRCTFLSILGTKRGQNMDGPQMESTAPEHILRRRSSILAEQVLEAIRERDDEIFEETLHFDFLALGGGVAAGYWAETIAGSLSRRGRTAAIVSGDPEGLVPFERPALSKACLDPNLEGLRDFSEANSGQFPFVCKGSGGSTHPLQWYKANDIVILAGCQAVFVDLDQKYVKVKRVIPSGSNDQLVFGDTIKVMFGRLLVATGVRPRRIGESPLNGMAKSLQGSCFCTRHPDLSGSPLKPSHPESFGFGSVHYVRDLGDTLKIVKAMTSIEVDGQDTCKDPIVLVGGGFITCEVAAAIASHCPGMRLTMVVPGETIMSRVGFDKEICQFYEEQLARAGVDFAKGYRVNRLWRMEEEGSFPTLERTSQGSVLKKTSPRNFGPADPHFTDSRGVVLFDKKTKEEVWLPARFVVLGIGSIPNSDLFKNTLDLSRDGGIVTDSSLRTSHPSGDIFAAGDVACSPVPLAGGDDVEGESTPKILRFEHVKTARDMGMVAARAMLEGDDTEELYNPVPYMYSRFLGVSWKFFGFTRGQACMVGMENYPSTKMFGAFWVFKGRIVGAFLETGSESEVDHSATLERMAREQPPVLSIKRLRKCPLEKILSDPYCLAPPKLGVGEFHADTDISSIEETFQNFAKTNDKVKREDVAAVMRDLGADWDEDELADALEGLDPSNSGFVHMQDFIRWWTN